MISNFQKIKKGFSLLEVLVAIAILVLMTSVVFMRQGSNKAKSEVEAAARQVSAQLRLLQNDALNGKVTSNGIACRAVMKVTENLSTYTTVYVKNCDSTQDEFDSSSTVLRNVQFSATGNVAFSSPLGNAGTTGLSNRITLTSTRDASVRATVCIFNSGRITDVFGTNCGAGFP